MKTRSRSQEILAASNARPAVGPVGLAAQLLELASLIQRHAPVDGNHSTSLPGVTLKRQSAPTGEVIHGVQEPAMCLVVQGAKQTLLNGEAYAYDASRYLVVSVDLPLSGRVTQATQAEPYLCFKLDLQPGLIAALILDGGIATPTDRGGSRGFRTSTPPRPDTAWVTKAPHSSAANTRGSLAFRRRATCGGCASSRRGDRRHRTDHAPCLKTGSRALVAKNRPAPLHRTRADHSAFPRSGPSCPPER
ncbi:MAG: AraC family transcriptional regulator [Gammaproteobacteria bacterium]